MFGPRSVVLKLTADTLVTVTVTCTVTCTVAAMNNVRLHPWRDGLEGSLARIKTAEAARAVGGKVSIDICFHMSDFPQVSDGKSSTMDWNMLFRKIGMLEEVESMIVRVVGMESEFDLSNYLPSVAAWTECLSQASQLVYLTLIGVSLEHGDDLDWNGLRETLRIHPSLQSVVLKECRFAATTQLESLQDALANSCTLQSKKRHSEFLENLIVEPVEGANESLKWYQNFAAWCLVPVAACL